MKPIGNRPSPPTVTLPSDAAPTAPKAPVASTTEGAHPASQAPQGWQAFGRDGGARAPGNDGGQTTFKPIELRTDLRRAFDDIEGLADVASTYRIDKNVNAFASRWKTLDGATKTFDTTYFIWEKDIFGMAYLGKMLDKAKQGVRIRAMMDATGDAGGSKGFKASFRGQDYLQELVNVDPKRVQVGIYNPLLKKDLTSLSSLVASNHDKLAIADGEVVETGGRNMAAHYFSSPKDHHGVYRDTDLHIESKGVAAKATRAFEAEFNNAKVTDQVKPDRFDNWSKKDIELLGAASMMDDWLNAKPFTEAEKAEIRSAETPPKHHVDAVVAQVLAKLPAKGINRQPSGREVDALRKLATQLVTNPELRGRAAFDPKHIEGEVQMIDNVSASGEGANQISDGLISMIGAAKKSILIHNPYVVLTDKALNALADAGKRGVQITFGTNSPESTDSAVTQAYFQEDWPLILARIPNSRIITATGDQKHHAKTFVVDDVMTGVSTYNADWISARVNSEIVTLEWSEAMAQDTKASYQEMVNDPEHGAVEYNILRDGDGKALVLDGKAIVSVGPESHMDPTALDKKYSILRRGANWARENLDALAPLLHKPLTEATDPVTVVDWRTDDEAVRKLAQVPAGRAALTGIINKLDAGWTSDEEAAQVDRLQRLIGAAQ
jgi:putative cardiolipin synthase